MARWQGFEVCVHVCVCVFLSLARSLSCPPLVFCERRGKASALEELTLCLLVFANLHHRFLPFWFRFDVSSILPFGWSELLMVDHSYRLLIQSVLQPFLLPHVKSPGIEGRNGSFSFVCTCSACTVTCLYLRMVLVHEVHRLSCMDMGWLHKHRTSFWYSFSLSFLSVQVNC